MKFVQRLFSTKGLDERIVMEQNKIGFNCYIICQALAIIAVIYVLIANQNLLELSGALFILIVSNIFVFIKLRNNDIKISELNIKDEFILNTKNKIFKEGYYLALYVIIATSFLLVVYQITLGSILPFKNYTFTNTSIVISNLNMGLVMIPAFYFTVIGIKRGVIGNSKINRVDKITKKKPNLKKFRIRCIYGGIFFGLLMGITAFSKGGILQGIKTGVFAGVSWGVLFYFLMILMMKWSEKRADKNL